MISHQARVTKLLIKSAKTNKRPTDIKKQRRAFERNMRLLFPTLGGAHVKHDTVAGVPVEWITPGKSARRIIVYVHGGAFALGSSRAYRQHMVRLARVADAKVLAVEYSLAPEHPYPQAINELYKVWAELPHKKHIDPSHVAFAGDSAGANILLATTLKLRDAKLPLPACLVLLSAGLDATFSGESYKLNEAKDVLFTPEALDFYMQNYVQHHDKKHPHISPIFADLHGLPPTLIHVGSEEMMLSTSTNLYENAQRDGVDATLFIGQNMWHGWHLFAGFVPEAKLAMQKVGDYIKNHT